MDAALTIKLPNQVVYIIDMLMQRGYEAFAVGGCVRDSIIGRGPEDWDIATSAKPQQVKEVFDRTIDTGLTHGTVTVLVEGGSFEVTTYRTEGKYINNRRPESVSFIDSIEEDLGRRDFTINAMAYNDFRGLIDPYNGLLDIERQTIKAVGNPSERFEEDALRMLRAIRFSAQLGYAVDTDTFQAILDCSALISNISAERIREELTKTLMADPLCFTLLHEGGLLKRIIPELDQCFYINQYNPYHIYNAAVHSLHSAAYIAKNQVLRWTMLLHDIGKADTISTDEKGIDHFYNHSQASVQKAENIMKRLRFDNSSSNKIRQLILHHDREIADSEISIRKAIADIGTELFADLLMVKEADIRAQQQDKASDRLAKLHRIKVIYEKISLENQCLTIKDLAVDGNDMVAIGFKQDRELGRVLKALLDRVLEQPELNSKAALLDMAKQYLRYKG